MPNTPIVVVMHDWGSVAENFDSLGATVLEVDTLKEVALALPVADALILTGGGDVNPDRYAPVRHRQVYGVDEDRDEMEFLAVQYARKRRLPMFGICRGHQLLNIAHGGTLHQHLGDNPHVGRHSGGDHEIVMRPGALITKSVGLQIDEGTTTLHHQAVDRLGAGLLAAGWAEDGTVEVIETVPRLRPYVLGVQFHPEMDWSKNYSDRIFEHFYREVVRRSHMSADHDKRIDGLEWMIHRTVRYNKNQYFPKTNTGYKRWNADKKDWEDCNADGTLKTAPALPSGGSEDSYWGGHGDYSVDLAAWRELNKRELERQMQMMCEVRGANCSEPGECALYGECLYGGGGAH